MRSVLKPRIKICCIQSLDEARLAIEHGASALGLVSAMPSGPGVIAEEQIAEIADAVPPPIGTFLLTSFRSADEIIAQQRRCRTNTIQICDALANGTHRDIRRALPGIALVQVIHIAGEESIRESVAVASEVDALLLDSGRPSLPVKELGGTGRTHDWQISRRIRELVEVPIFLAGGLTPANVATAVREVGPFALDVCSGVRTNGKLDEAKLKAFFDTSSGTIQIDS
jgi:phosphoribosylanthranilate isomerase